MSKHSQEESRHQEQILKLQADMATRIAKYEERILSLEEQLKVLSTSQKEMRHSLLPSVADRVIVQNKAYLYKGGVKGYLLQKR